VTARTAAFLAGTVLVSVASYMVGQARGAAAPRVVTREVVAAPAAAATPVVVHANATVDEDALAEAVRKVVRAELDARATKKDPSPGTAEADAARERGLALVNAARASRRWTEQDRRALAALLPSLGSAGIDEVLGPLLTAVNVDAIHVDTNVL
jgi:hypothetical protein